VEVAFSHWSASWPVLGCYAVVLGTYLVGALRLRAAGRPEPVAQAIMLQLGLLIMVLALVSPLGHWSDVYIWVRALQELALILIGPGLVVLGAPWTALRWAVRPTTVPEERSVAADDGGTVRRVPLLLRLPVLAVIGFNVVFLGWHLPVLFDLARSNSTVGAVEHVSYVAAGLLFWLQLIGSRPFSPLAAPMRRVAYLTATVGASTILGMVLVFASGVFYPVYAGAAHHVMTVLDDQQLAGAALWMGVLPPTIIAAVAILMQWLGNEESAELSAGLDRLLTPRKHAWPSRPVIR
jgi:putative membrane protein